VHASSVHRAAIAPLRDHTSQPDPTLRHCSTVGSRRSPCFAIPLFSRSSRKRRDEVTHDVATHTSRLTVFLDPSGRRWRRLRLFLIIVLGLLVAGGWWVVPRLSAPVALHGRHAVSVTSAQTGRHPPVVGQGPLVRVVKVVREGSGLEAVDPFTGNRVGLLPARDAARARQAIAAGKPPTSSNDSGTPLQPGEPCL
jgi:hypothetical protein